MKINFERKNKDSQSGFTLVEVLVVMGIIGLLASVVLVGLGSFRTRSRDARRIADLREVQNALELYYAKNNSQYPASANWSALTTALIDAGIGVSNIPKDPLKTDYFYCYSTADPTPQSYILGAQFEDASNPALNDDVDLIPSGFSCSFTCDDGQAATKQMYCVRF